MLSNSRSSQYGRNCRQNVIEAKLVLKYAQLTWQAGWLIESSKQKGMVYESCISCRSWCRLG